MIPCEDLASDNSRLSIRGILQQNLLTTCMPYIQSIQCLIFLPKHSIGRWILWESSRLKPATTVVLLQHQDAWRDLHTSIVPIPTSKHTGQLRAARRLSTLANFARSISKACVDGSNMRSLTLEYVEVDIVEMEKDVYLINWKLVFCHYLAGSKGKFPSYWLYITPFASKVICCSITVVILHGGWNKTFLPIRLRLPRRKKRYGGMYYI